MERRSYRRPARNKVTRQSIRYLGSQETAAYSPTDPTQKTSGVAPPSYVDRILLGEKPGDLPASAIGRDERT
jgi:hypothetical protein